MDTELNSPIPDLSHSLIAQDAWNCISVGLVMLKWNIPSTQSVTSAVPSWPSVLSSQMPPRVDMESWHIVISSNPASETATGANA